MLWIAKGFGWYERFFSYSSFIVDSRSSFFALLPFLFHLISFHFSFSTSLSSSCSGLVVGRSTSLPLLRVITTLTSLTCEDSPSWASTSWILLGFWWGWEGNFPLSCTVLRLVSLEIEYWRLSISEIDHFASHPSFCLHYQFFDWAEHWWISGLQQSLLWHC